MTNGLKEEGVISKTSVNGKVLNAILKNNLPFYTVKKIIGLIGEDVKEVAVNVAIQNFQKKGLLIREDRGVYTLNGKPEVKIEEGENCFKVVNPSLVAKKENGKKMKKALKALEDLEKYINEKEYEGLQVYIDSIREKIEQKMKENTGTTSVETKKETTEQETTATETKTETTESSDPVVD
jgi:hypothetical protein